MESFEMQAGIATVYDSRADWLEARRGCLGGSDIAAILGLTSFTSPLEVFYSKVDNVPERSEEQMAWGSILEPVILKQWATEAGVMYDDRLMIVRSLTFPFLGGSPDAIQTDSDGIPERWVEIKNVRTDRDWKNEVGMPERVYAQVQHGMLCSGLSDAVVVALVGGSKLIEREVSADPIYQHAMILKAEAFWSSHVRTNVPPAPDGSESSARALQRASDAPQGSVEVPYDLLMEYRAAAESLSTCKDEVERLKQLIEAEMVDAEEGTVDGVPVCTWKVSTRNTIDTTRLRKENPEIAAKYNKTTTTRIFRLL